MTSCCCVFRLPGRSRLFFWSILWHPSLATPAIPLNVFIAFPKVSISPARIRSDQNLRFGLLLAGCAGNCQHSNSCGRIGPGGKKNSFAKAGGCVIPQSDSLAKAGGCGVTESDFLAKAGGRVITESDFLAKAGGRVITESDFLARAGGRVSLAHAGGRVITKARRCAQLRRQSAGRSAALDRRIGTYGAQARVPLWLCRS